MHHARGTGRGPRRPCDLIHRGTLVRKTGAITVTNAVWIPGVFSCCFLNPQFSLYTNTSYLMPCVSSGRAGTRQKEIRQRTLEQRRPRPRRHMSPPHCLTAALTLTRPELCCATGRLSSCRISYLFPGQALMALTEGRWLQVSTENTGRHTPPSPAAATQDEPPPTPGSSTF